MCLFKMVNVNICFHLHISMYLANDFSPSLMCGSVYLEVQRPSGPHVGCPMEHVMTLTLL